MCDLYTLALAPENLELETRCSTGRFQRQNRHAEKTKSSNTPNDRMKAPSSDGEFEVIDSKKSTFRGEIEKVTSGETGEGTIDGAANLVPQE